MIENKKIVFVSAKKQRFYEFQGMLEAKYKERCSFLPVFRLENYDFFSFTDKVIFDFTSVDNFDWPPLIEPLFEKKLHRFIPVFAVINPEDLQHKLFRKWIRKNFIRTLIFYPFDEQEIADKLEEPFPFKETKNEHKITADDVWFRNLFFLDGIFTAMQKEDIFNIYYLFEKLVDFFKNNLFCSDVLAIQYKNGSAKVYHNSFERFVNYDDKTFIGIGEISRVVSYGEPVIKNNIKKNSGLAKMLSEFSSPVAHALIFPVTLHNHNTFIWILLREEGEEFGEFEFVWTGFLLKMMQILSGYIFFEHDESAKWNRLKVLKRKMVSLQKIFDTFRFGIIVLDSNFNIRIANQSSKDILNITMDNLEGEPLSAIIDNEKFTIIEKAFSLEEKEYRGEFEYIVSRNEKKMIGFSVYPRVEIEDELFIVLLFKDISEEKEIQQELIKMDRLSTLGIMASEIAHEIRNPLAGIKAISQTMKDELEATSPAIEYVDRIIKQSNRIEKLLKSMFSYAKPPRPNLSISNLEKIIEEISLLMQERLRNKNINFSYYINKGAKFLFLDAGQFQQILLNLILNAIDAIESDGNIKLIARPLYKIPQKFIKLIPTVKAVKYAKITIQDDGAGINKEDMPKLFMPFFTTKSQGTGLGLSIVYQLVKEHNGHIYFESQPGKGTSCHIIMPMGESSTLTK